METIRKYKWNEVVWEKLNVGDTVQLPEFTVSETTIGGDRELHFGEQTVKDTATVYNIKNGKVYLVFDHALFTSAIDLNNATEWKNTQLYNYLKGIFKNSMKNARIPVSKVSLLSKDEILGEKALPFFKNEKNRIAFEKDTSYITWYWLKNASSMPYFCYTDGISDDSCNSVSDASLFIRPCLIVKKEG